MTYTVDQHGQGEAHEAHEAHEEHHEGCECGHEEERGLFFIGDFLLVRPRRRALDFVINAPVLGNNVIGKVESLDWDTVGAYRIAAGYRLGHGWEVGGTYFYLHSKDDRTISALPAVRCSPP